MSKKADSRPKKEKQYYLQDSRGYAGNIIIWWGMGRRGYTSDLRKAHVFSEEEAISQNKCRATDIPWPKSYVDSKGHPTVVDMQYVKIKEALKGTGIKLAKEKKYRSPTINCYGCGRFLSIRQVYEMNCPKCGADNSP